MKSGPKMLICAFLQFQMTLHIAYVHASVNPTLFLVLHRGLRFAAFRLCCGFLYDWLRSLNQHPVPTAESPHCDEMDFVVEVPQANLLVPPPPPPVAHQQQPVVAQINSSIKSTPSPYHRCGIQVRSVSLNCTYNNQLRDFRRQATSNCNVLIQRISRMLVRILHSHQSYDNSD